MHFQLIPQNRQANVSPAATAILQMLPIFSSDLECNWTDQVWLYFDHEIPWSSDPLHEVFPSFYCYYIIYFLILLIKSSINFTNTKCWNSIWILYKCLLWILQSYTKIYYNTLVQITLVLVIYFIYKNAYSDFNFIKFLLELLWFY